MLIQTHTNNIIALRNLSSQGKCALHTSKFSGHDSIVPFVANIFGDKGMSVTVYHVEINQDGSKGSKNYEARGS